MAETPLTDTLDAEHTRHLALQALLVRTPCRRPRRLAQGRGTGAERAAALADLELE
ncbi:hypothetical protein [Streptomyces sp. NPDC057689]|uniref:hypothetical protein n=1 Tax=Streptomyces sp. NPDC057689 TaxID=3346213 RepID=UPI00369E58A4